MRIRYAAATHQGRVRGNNEDNFYVQGEYRRDVNVNTMELSGRARPQAFLAAVCDGMGGEEAGETASLMAVESLRPHTLGELPDAAFQDIAEANGRICGLMTENSGRRSGSTLAALYVDGGEARAVNVGDSRVYLYREGRLRQLSHDHSRAQSLIDSGILTPDQAKAFKDRHVLTQHLGIFPEEMTLEPWTAPPEALTRGDIYLLCSDGLTDMLWDQEIAAILASHRDPARLAAALVEGALASGGVDNVTVVVLRVR